MSGICGLAARDGRPVAARELAGVLGALRPLGPDGEGTWERDSVALGVCGGRPALSPDGAVCVVADALLDCRDELLASVPLPATASDAELILAAYERWGDSCLDRLSGEFAFAVADGRRAGTLIARDQIGARPLQVHRAPGAIAFASTALALCGLDGVGHALDRERVAEWLALVMDTERTFVAGVTALPAGHCAWIGREGFRRWRYWELDPGRIVELGSREEYAEALRSEIDAAVERRLPADEPVGVLLSGGLDSTSVAATAAMLRPDDVVRTYTAAPPPGWRGSMAPWQDADESGLVRDLARLHQNLQPAFVSGELGPLLASFDRRFEAGSPPPRNPWNELWMTDVHRRAAADGVPVLLTGVRGNVCFSADDPYWLIDLLMRGRLGALRNELADLGARRSARALARQAAPRALHRLRAALHERQAGIGTADRLRFAGPDAAEVVVRRAHDFDPVPRRSLRAVMSRALEWSGFVAEAAAVRDALTGVRRTDPTGDVRLLAVCATQPAWVRRRGGRTRAVVRDAMADRLPRSIAEREQRGAQLPDWLDHFAKQRDELAAELSAARESPSCRELIDLDRVASALAAGLDEVHWARSARVYRDDLTRALLMCRYLRFFESHAARTRVVTV